MSSTTLPVADVFPDILSALTHHPSIIVNAPPGAGKSTWLPLALLRAVDNGELPHLAGKKIMMLEPRRLAARSIAGYLARQLNEPVGQRVGFRMRQEANVSAQTQLEIVTEGILTRMIQADPELESVGLIIFDEFHERSLQADLGLALALDVQQGLRDDLSIMVMSATLDDARLEAILDAPVIKSEGRSYPVDVIYHPVSNQGQRAGMLSMTGQQHAMSPVVYQTAKSTLAALSNHDGNMLVFLPGVREITQVASWLEQSIDDKHVLICPLFGKLTQQQQQQAINAPEAPYRKIVIATNIAQTSLTIEGITVVIDSGLQREAVFNPKTGLTQLRTQQIAKSSAIQRAGRAGRLAPGVCYRIDEERQFERRAAYDKPEIHSADLSSLLLDVLSWGATIDAMNWIDSPPSHLINQAQSLLQRLEAVDDAGTITPFGRQIQQLALPPRLAHMVLKAIKLADDITPELPQLAIWLAALLDEGDKRSGSSDLAHQVSQFFAQRKQNTPAHRLAMRWLKQLKLAELTHLPVQYTGLVLALAYPDRIARQRTSGQNSYLLAHGFGADLAEGDHLTGSEWLVAATLTEATHQHKNTVTIRAAASVEPQDIEQWLPWLIASKEHMGWDLKSGTLKAERQIRLGAIVLLRAPISDGLSDEQKKQALLAYVQQKGLNCLNWTPKAIQLKHRLACARQLQMPDQQIPERAECNECNEEWPDVSDEYLLQSLEHWLGPYVQPGKGQQVSASVLNNVQISDALLSLLEWDQQQWLNEHIPATITTPAGQAVVVDYTSQGNPAVSVKVQALFGLQDTIRIAQGKLPLRIELLSPANRPIQITEDLGRFWQTSWHEVAKEMRGRYPKHRWPDDPANEKPGSSIKNRIKK